LANNSDKILHLGRSSRTERYNPSDSAIRK
jgi:hypothetical protein